MRSLLLLLLLTLPAGAALADADALRGPVIATDDLAPGFPAPERIPTGVLASAVKAFERGDLLTARSELDALIADRRVWGSDRIGAHFLLGWINARLGHHQQASANFYRVRKAEDHPLAEYATYLEAQADLDRGHPATAVQECASYLEQWPEGRWAGECQLVQADANADRGLLKAAVEQYEAFLEANPDDQREEGVSLRIARALEKLGHHEAAGRRYRALYLNHKMPTTGNEAEAALARLGASGAELPAITDEDLYVRACSLRRSGQFDASYDLYCDLDARNPADGDGATPLGARLDNERHEFLWRNRRYEEVGKNNAWVYDRNPDAPDAADHAFWAVRGFSRSGRFADAVRYQKEGMRRFPNHHRFRRTEERLALLLMGAAQYAEAREAWLAWQNVNSRARRSTRVKFDIAYCAYRTKDYETAASELEEIAKGTDKTGLAARYYLGKVQLRQKKWTENRSTWNALLDDAPDSWYAQVIRNVRRRARGEPAPPNGRNGLWPGEARSAPPVVAAGMDTARAVPALWARSHESDRSLRAGDAPERGPDGRPKLVLADAPLDVGGELPPRELLLARLRSEAIPTTWQENQRWSRDASLATWKEFAEDHSEAWPDLAVAYELSRIGLGEFAGPMVAAIYDDIRAYRRSSRVRREAAAWSKKKTDDPVMRQKADAQTVNLRARDWMAVFAGAGYPGSVTAFAVDSIPFRSLGRESEDARRTWTLAYPAAFAPQVWRTSWENGVDPLLMLSIMRAESVYKHDAVSPVGALGLIQVMPATGSKVAALSNMEGFRVERLLEPAVNIGVGTWYMGRLMERFGPGMFPLAVGSYNGGPHNIGRWLKAKVGHDLEDFVEEIAFDETRYYVKKVTRFYSIYADLYGDHGSVILPAETVTDDPSVINF